MSTVTKVRWVVAPIEVKKADVPADWPTDDELAEICAPNRFDLMAKAIVALMNPADWELYSKFAEREAEMETRCSS